MSLYQPVIQPETTRYCLSQIELPDDTISQIGEISTLLDVNLEQILVRAVSLLHEELKQLNTSNEADRSTICPPAKISQLDRDRF